MNSTVIPMLFSFDTLTYANLQLLLVFLCLSLNVLGISWFLSLVLCVSVEAY